jgi:hypothetical protein
LDPSDPLDPSESSRFDFTGLRERTDLPQVSVEKPLERTGLPPPDRSESIEATQLINIS